MSAKLELDLVGVAWPSCLLEFKNTFDELCSCQVLEVLSHDPDVIQNILMIACHSEAKLIKEQQEEDLYRVFIQKE